MSTSRDKTAEAIVVGGGVIGLTIARALHKRGLTRIRLIERGAIGAEASWAAGGILAPQVEADGIDDFFRIANASRDMYPDFARELTAESGIDVELDTSGTIYLAFTEAEEAELRARYDWQQRGGLKVEWLTAGEVRRTETNVSPHVRCALRFPDDWQIENRLLVQALLRANQKAGITMTTKCQVLSLCIEGGKVCGVRTAVDSISSDIVIIAAGAWTSSIDPGCSIKVEPVRGQMLCFKPKQKLAGHVLYSSKGYLVPRRDGRLLAGSTTESAGFDKRV